MEEKLNKEKGKNAQMNSFKTDFLAAGAIGLIAGPLSFFILTNFGLSIIPWWILLIFFVLLCILGIILARVIGNFVSVIYQLGKFAEAGGLNFLMDIGIYNILIILFATTADLSLTLFKGISFTFAVINSYFWNKLWVFVKKDKTPQEAASEFTKFVTVSIGGLIISATVVYLVSISKGLVADTIAENLWANVAAVVAALSAMAWNFVGYKLFVFKR